MDWLKDKKNLIIGLLCALSIIKISQVGLFFALWILGGVFLSCFSDVLITKIAHKKNILPKSAAISGFITAGILDYHQPWFILVIFSLLPILSKHLLKFNGRHIFNPANFSLFIAALFKIPLTWNIESNIYLIIPVGLYMAYYFRKIPHLIGFFLVFCSLFITEAANPLILVSWFFVFIMLIEPKTSGFGWRRGLAFGSIAGAGSFLIFKFFPRYDFFISALFIANFCNPVLDKIKNHSAAPPVTEPRRH